MDEVAVQVGGFGWSHGVVLAGLAWVALGLILTAVVHFTSWALRDYTYPALDGYGAAWILGPFAIGGIFLLRRNGRTNFPWRVG